MKDLAGCACTNRGFGVRDCCPCVQECIYVFLFMHVHVFRLSVTLPAPLSLSFSLSPIGGWWPVVVAEALVSMGHRFHALVRGLVRALSSRWWWWGLGGCACSLSFFFPISECRGCFTHARAFAGDLSFGSTCFVCACVSSSPARLRSIAIRAMCEDEVHWMTL